MKILLVNPETPETFWNFKNAIKFISKRSSEPPLGLITVAALLPVAWDKRLVDMNIDRLRDGDILWADLVFLGGMSIQRRSFLETAERCKRLGATVVGGGPLCTTEYEALGFVDHFVIGEAERVLPEFVKDLASGNPLPVYRSEEYPPLCETPMPLWHLLDMKAYATMDVQFSRGCPFDCEFCSITAMFGRKVRTKGTEQFLRELESLYIAGWRGAVFVVDDNFIGNKGLLKRELIPAMIEWSKTRGYPFTFSTEASINLADDEELMDLMVGAGFEMVFVGIETPDANGLASCDKRQNQGRDLIESVKILQRHGFDVTAGFIVGFDTDGEDIFDRQIEFIQKSGIVTAMVGLLNAPAGTRLHRRLHEEHRITDTWTGNNVDCDLNFIPAMDKEKLIAGYKRILRTIYSPSEYFERVMTFLGELERPILAAGRLTANEIRAFFRAFWRLGILSKGKRFFWKLIFRVLHEYPAKLPEAVSLAIRGFHFRLVSEAVS